MKTGTRRRILQLVGFVVIASLAREAAANEANISCGQPTKPVGGVRVLITFEDGTQAKWDVSGILKTDSPDDKAVKIRAAAPSSHAKLKTSPTTKKVAGGTSNVVSVETKNGAKIKAMIFKTDTTGEKEASNVFALLPSDHRGLVSVAGVATGLDSDGAPAFVSVTASGATALVDTAPEMSGEAIEDQIIEQLTTAGVSASLANADFIAASFPGAEGDGRLVIIDDIDATGLETNNTDVGITMDVSGLIDVSVEPIPILSEWGLIIMVVALLTAGAIIIVRRRRRLVAA